MLNIVAMGIYAHCNRIVECPVAMRNRSHPTWKIHHALGIRSPMPHDLSIPATAMTHNSTFNLYHQISLDVSFICTVIKGWNSD